MSVWKVISGVRRSGRLPYICLSIAYAAPIEKGVDMAKIFGCVRCDSCKVTSHLRVFIE